MRRLCERPGCSAPAEVSYGIDNAALLVWIDNRPLPERELAGRLCRRHADALSVPRGWSVDDRRQAIPQLFRPADLPAAEPVKKAKKPPKPAKSTEPNEKKLSLFETIAEELAEIEKVQEAPIPTADPDETRAIPWSPRLSGAYEEDEDQDAPILGRLMGRAFGQRRDEGK
ncbi:MAG: DUF3499 family protein [Ilumatobacteraceae bacterium]|nr:DUF3499 family protein [Ilumatobacteraceae bacterium]